MTVGADLSREIIELLRASGRPLTGKQVAAEVLGSATPKTLEKIGAALTELIAQGTAFEYPPERSGYGARFWCVNPTDRLAERIMAEVAQADGRLTLRRLRAGLKKWEIPYFDQVLGNLLREKKLFYLTMRFKYVLSSPPDPYDHLLPRQITALREILERINRHRKNALTLEEARDILNGRSSTEIAPPQATGIPTEDLLREWYNRDLPKRAGLASIPIPWTWTHYESWCTSNKARPDLQRFQEILRSLHRAGRIELIAHSMTQSLPERESEISPRGPHGEVWYYWKWR